MPKPRTGKVWSVGSEEFAAIVAASSSYSEILRKLSFKHFSGTGSYRVLKRRIEEEGLDVSHLDGARAEQHARLRANGGLRRPPLKEVMVEGSSYDRRSLKRRLISEGILKEECSECGSPPAWNGKPLALQLDHKNGISDDARPENLRLLCPNCHSQTETWGRKARGPKKQRVWRSAQCVRCGSPASSRTKTGLCRECFGDQQTEGRPDTETLAKQVAENGWEATGRAYGVSGNTIRNWLR